MASEKKPLYLPENDLDKLAPFRLDNETAIRKILAQMVDDRSLISLYSSNDPNLFIISRLLSATTSDLEFDLQTDEERTRFLKEQSSVTVVGFLDQVKVQFEADIHGIRPSEADPVLLCRPPTTLYRIQRRDAYRVRPPVGDPAQLVIRGAPGEEHEHDILDLSATGVAFRLREDQPAIDTDQLIEHARMELGPQIPIPVSIVIRSVLPMSGGAPGHQTFRVGAEFAHLPGPVSRRIQIYVQDTERATLRLRGLR